MPLDWVVENQSGLDPTFPYTASVASPWESPTRVVLGPLLLDVLLVLAILTGVWLGARALLPRLRASAGPG